VTAEKLPQKRRRAVSLSIQNKENTLAFARLGATNFVTPHSGSAIPTVQFQIPDGGKGDDTDDSEFDRLVSKKTTTPEKRKSFREDLSDGVDFNDGFGGNNGNVNKVSVFQAFATGVCCTVCKKPVGKSSSALRRHVQRCHSDFP